MIETPRLILRPPEARDVAAIARAIEEDPDIAWFIPLIPTPYTEADARQWLAGIPDRLATIAETPFAITEKAGFIRGGMVIHEPPFGDGGIRALRYEWPR